MRKIFFVFLCFSLNIFAQKTETFLISSLPIQGIILEKGWKWHAGDNADFAKTEFNDDTWQTIDPTKDIFDLPQLWKTEISWFRLKIDIDSSLAAKSIASLITQTGASDIYLNGTLISKYGNINLQTHHIKAETPIDGSFIGLPIHKSGQQTIAVRYALQKNITYLKFAGRPNVALVFQLMEARYINSYIKNNVTFYFDFFRFGVYLILTILHFALYWFDRSKKTNLYFFLYSFFYCLTAIIATLSYNQISSVEIKMLSLFSVSLFFGIGIMFFLTAVYEIFLYKKGIIYWSLSICFFIGIFILFTNYKNGFNYGVNIFTTLVLLELIRVTILARRKKMRGSNIVIMGVVGTIVFITIFNIIAYGNLPFGPNWKFGQLGFNLAYNLAFNISNLSVPLSISILLALEASITSRNLKLKVVEVEKLSNEKQHILFTQNEKLEAQVTERTTELQHSLDQLKATQNQLIQSEKLASLGELTAGIAHEIQNPLNFVNNFSEVSEELMVEMVEEVDKGNYDDVKAIAMDVQQNLNKINHHGKRASNIVKGMLEHSRKSSGQKELTDLNTLSEEYLNIAYHGLKAKDPDFSAELITNFDPTLPKINVVSQDIGRVILNLITNAFYAINEKNKKGEPGYEPKVTVTTSYSPNSPLTQSGNTPTSQHANTLILVIKDNGTGIPEHIKDKIFQPFFTTKPTGQGTGLGLSLAYDIVKTHGGELRVESTEGEGSEFIIILPW